MGGSDSMPATSMRSRLLFPFPAGGTWDAKTACASAETLMKLEPRYLASGHGPVLRDPVTMMQAAARKSVQGGWIAGIFARASYSATGRTSMLIPSISRSGHSLATSIASSRSAACSSI